MLTCPQDCLEYISWTYYFRRLGANPSFYLLEDASPQGISRHLTALLDGVMRDLEGAGCVEIDPDKDSYSPTVLGKIASYYYLDYRTARFFADGLDRMSTKLLDAKAKQPKTSGVGKGHVDTKLYELLLKLVCDAYEFSEIPVRHNEDLLNSELAQQLPWAVDPTCYGESNTKAFLLLQAYLYHVPLPIADYINDTRSVLDQVARVLNALIDIAADQGRLSIVLALMRLSQLIVQVCTTTCRNVYLITSDKLLALCINRV